MTPYTKYQPFIQDNYRIINKQQERVPFNLNPVQAKFVEQASGRDIILKARQQGFSSFILAAFATDFILKPDTHSVVVADDSDNAIGLLERVKLYLEEYEDMNKVKIPRKYDSKYELVNAANSSRYTIGTAQKTEFGRSKTITNLHFSEAAFYLHLRKLLAGAGTALVPQGRFVIETTANGFNEFKEFWDESVLGLTGFQPLFYKASDFYTTEFLEKEKMRLGEKLFMQEYPETPEEAFITSGDTYFDQEALKVYLTQAKVHHA